MHARRVFTVPEVERVVLERSRMLASIERYLRESEREAIQKKLDEEKRLMLDMVEAGEKSQAAQEKSSLVLNQAYFKRKAINNDLFE